MSTKITQILLVGTLVLTLAACGTGPKTTSVPNPVETQVVANTPEAGDLVIKYERLRR
jgi:starvation-inducible outer membrane lipoprotein